MAKRVAVIGAGASGLAAARHLVHHPTLECVVFERSDHVGGTWRLAVGVGLDRHGLQEHSSMYTNLRTNLPKEIMAFPDFKFPVLPKSYVGREDVLRYLESYTDHFRLRDHIRFHRLVKLVRPLEGGGWHLEALDLQTQQTESYRFDAVMVCNGHYSAPSWPEMAGSAEFQGKVLHSHDYREPEPFAGQRVLVVGAGPSAMDLTMEVAYHAEQVILSHHRRDPIQTVFPAHVLQRPDVERLTPSGATFKDGSSAELDAVIYCTGYNFEFPFLHADCGVLVDEGGVKPLYRHLVHIDHPTLVFLALPNHVVPFPLADLQARYFVRVLEGAVRLPSTEEMRAAAEHELAERRAAGLVGPRGSHRMGPRQRDYYDSLAAEAGVKPLPPVISAIHAESLRCITHDLYRYREVIFTLLDESKFLRSKFFEEEVKNESSTDSNHK